MKKTKPSNCEKCNGKLDTYYGLWCPRCDAPKPETQVTINLIKCLRYLEANGREGIRDRVWDFLSEDIHNAITIYLPYIPDGEEEYYGKDDCSGETLKADLSAIRALAGLGPEDALYVEISW